MTTQQNPAESRSTYPLGASPNDAVQPAKTSSTGSNMGVVVGIDGSSHCHAALRVAAEEATRHGVPLTLVCTYSLSPWSDTAKEAGHGMASESYLQQMCHENLEEAHRVCLSDHQGQVHHLARFGDPSTVLADLSVHAELVVVGSRGAGGVTGRLAGSLPTTLPRHIRSPVMIIPRNAPETDTPRYEAKSSAPVVVGLYGSARCHSAALLAAKEADSRQVPLRMVRCLRSIRSSSSNSEDTEAVRSHIVDELEGDRAWILHHYPALQVDAEVIDGKVVEVLDRESRDAQATVLGTYARGGFLGRLLGSTADGMLHSAEGPLMVAPFRRDARLKNRVNFRR